MIICPPVTFDDGVTFTPDGTSHTWPIRSGYDAQNHRVTNLVGHNGVQFIKNCPHCNRNLPETDFGYAGRDTGEERRRDQSNCTQCRARYNS